MVYKDYELSPLQNDEELWIAERYVEELKDKPGLEEYQVKYLETLRAAIDKYKGKYVPRVRNHGLRLRLLIAQRNLVCKSLISLMDSPDRLHKVLSGSVELTPKEITRLVSHLGISNTYFD